MATLQVILQQDVPNLGKTGDVKQVAAGYFRNYLQPRGLAIEATKGKMSALQSTAKVASVKEGKAQEQADAMARRIEDTTLTIPVKLGAQGRMYGSITNKDIAEALASQAAIEVDRREIELSEPLRSQGLHSVTVKLGHGIEAHLRVDLVPEEEPATT